jgi:hypothetical protein
MNVCLSVERIIRAHLACNKPGNEFVMRNINVRVLATRFAVS